MYSHHFHPQTIIIKQGSGDNFASGVAVGAISALIGFIFAVIWDMYKNWRDTQKKDLAIISTVREELLANVVTLSSIMHDMKRELELLKEHKSLVPSLTPVHTASWNLIIASFPQQLSANIQIFNDLRQAILTSHDLNEVIKSRENYRINNGSMTNFESRLTKYDMEILQYAEFLQKEIIKLSEWFNKLEVNKPLKKVLEEKANQIRTEGQAHLVDKINLLRNKFSRKTS